jgi:acyl-CoA synthetase (NDP forming)
MKIISPDILHKSDAGGVKVNIKNEVEVREAYHTILENAHAYKADARSRGLLSRRWRLGAQRGYFGLGQ